MSSEKGVGPGRETELSPFGGGNEERGQAGRGLAGRVHGVVARGMWPFGSLAATHHTRACDQRVSMREREDTGELASWGGWSPPLLKLGRERPGASGSGWMGPEWPKVGQALVWNWTPQGGAVSGHPPLSTGRPVDGSWVRAGGEGGWKPRTPLPPGGVGTRPCRPQPCKGPL